MCNSPTIFQQRKTSYHLPSSIIFSRNFRPPRLICLGNSCIPPLWHSPVRRFFSADTVRLIMGERLNSSSLGNERSSAHFLSNSVWASGANFSLIRGNANRFQLDASSAYSFISRASFSSPSCEHPQAKVAAINHANFFFAIVFNPRCRLNVLCYPLDELSSSWI